MNKRYNAKCSPTHQCSDEEIQGILDELRAVRNDDNIISYEYPSVENMKKIIATAESYDEEWYHSNVILNEYEFVSDEHKNLINRIIELGQDHGIFLSYIMNISEEEEKAILSLKN